MPSLLLISKTSWLRVASGGTSTRSKPSLRIRNSEPELGFWKHPVQKRILTLSTVRATALEASTSTRLRIGCKARKDCIRRAHLDRSRISILFDGFATVTAVSDGRLGLVAYSCDTDPRYSFDCLRLEWHKYSKEKPLCCEAAQKVMDRDLRAESCAFESAGPNEVVGDVDQAFTIAYKTAVLSLSRPALCLC